MKIRLFLTLVMAIVVSGCVSSNKQVVNNVFVSESTPVAEVVIPADYQFIGSVKNISSEERWSWKKESYIFIKDADGNKVVDSGIDLLINKINTSFVTDYFGAADKYVEKEQVDVNGKMCQKITQAVAPSSSGFMTRYILDKGYGQADLVLVTILALPVRSDVMFEVGYYEDISKLGYTRDEWNDGKLDDKQIDFLRDFNSRAHSALNLSKVQIN